MRLSKNHTAGVIIDVQEKLFPHMHHRESLEKNINILIEGLKILEIPLLVTEQYTKGLGFTIPSVQESIGNQSKIEKVAFSCCDSPDFMSHLQNMGKTHVVVAGIEAHVCVLQTVVDLLDNGFRVAVVTDCISSRKQTDQDIALRRIEQEGAMLSTYESVLFELCRYSGTDQFKSISKLVK